MKPEAILPLFQTRGHVAYEGEGVTQLQHAWQCARLAEQAQASEALRLAAWLHDLGHLASALQGTPTLEQVDDQHEKVAAQLLAPSFGDAVSVPVSLHVQAKRYLVATNPAYHARLSADSVRSLALQGGPMNAEEAVAFRASPWADDALRLRSWDEAAKRADWQPETTQGALLELAQLMALLNVSH
jgi:phosphonate degradation associated HDIG domain protein